MYESIIKPRLLARRIQAVSCSVQAEKLLWHSGTTNVSLTSQLSFHINNNHAMHKHRITHSHVSFILYLYSRTIINIWIVFFEFDYGAYNTLNTLKWVM